MGAFFWLMFLDPPGATGYLLDRGIIGRVARDGFYRRGMVLFEKTAVIWPVGVPGRTKSMGRRGCAG